MTPSTSATNPSACQAISPGDTCTRSPNTTMPSTIPATGSAAVIAGNEACSGAALKALCISHRPTTATPTSV